MQVQQKKRPSKKKPKSANQVPRFEQNASRNPKKKKVSTKKVHKKEIGKKRPKAKINKRRQRKLLFLELGLTLATILVIFVLLNIFVFSFPKVNGYSMSPTLADGDVLYVNRLAKIRRFEMVSMKEPATGKVVVRRIIGLPGEDIRYQDDQLFVDNEEKSERFIEAEISENKKNGAAWTEDFTLKEQFKLTQLPKGKYLVLGDNRPYATDSRYFGLVDEKDIIGVVKTKILPLQNATNF